MKIENKKKRYRKREREVRGKEREREIEGVLKRGQNGKEKKKVNTLEDII